MIRNGGYFTLKAFKIFNYSEYVIKIEIKFFKITIFFNCPSSDLS